MIKYILINWREENYVFCDTLEQVNKELALDECWDEYNDEFVVALLKVNTETGEMCGARGKFHRVTHFEPN